MQQPVVVRSVDGELVWYPPGNSGQALALSERGELSRLQATAGARRAPLVFAVPGADVVLREVSFKASEKRHIAGSLPYLLEDEFAADIETLHFASRPVSRLSLGVAACARARMSEWDELLDELPELPNWVPEALLLPWQSGELTLVIGPENVLARTGANTGFSIERELAPAILSSLAEENEYSSVIVYGMEQQSDQTLLPEAFISLLQWRTGDFGSALMLSENGAQLLNLRQGDFGSSLPLGQWWRQWRLVAAVFAVAFCLQLTSTWFDYSQLEDQNLHLRQQIEAAYREAVPRGAVVDPEKQLQRKLSELRGGVQGAGFVSVVEKIGRVVQAQKGAQLTSINFNDKVGDVRLNIVVPDFKAVEAIREGMAGAGLEATTENSNAQGDLVRARLKVREKRA